MIRIFRSIRAHAFNARAVHGVVQAAMQLDQAADGIPDVIGISDIDVERGQAVLFRYVGHHYMGPGLLKCVGRSPSNAGRTTRYQADLSIEFLSAQRTSTCIVASFQA